jgi:MFS family permease
LLASGGLALATTPEAFLVLWANQGGIIVTWIPLLWASVHGVKALVSAPAGALSDRLGRLQVVSIGWTTRVLLLLAFAWLPDDGITVWALFLGYAAAMAFTEGAERALVGDFAPPEQKATVFGILWLLVSMSSAFLTAAVLTVISAMTLRMMGSEELMMSPPHYITHIIKNLI